MEHIAKTVKKCLAGKNIKCKTCQSEQAYISLEDGRYMVRCPVCGNIYHLKVQHE